jgi:hypothetical protein
MTEAFSIKADTQFVKQLFQASGYEVPPYQRHYAWTTKQCEQLWNDLSVLHSERDEVHFLGSVVFVQKANCLEVVDGQQRLATLSLLFAAIVAALIELGDDLAGAVRDQCLSTLDMPTRKHHPKLKLNRGDEHAFRTIITKTPQLPDDPTKKQLLAQLFAPGEGVYAPSESSKQIVENYDYFLKQIRATFQTGQAIIEFKETVTNRVQTVQILANNDEAAYRLFETLNDRGVELSVSDLIKNHLYSLTRSDSSEMQAYWQMIEAAVGGHRIPDFLRHNYISQHGNIQKEKLFRKLKEACTTHEQALTLVRDMRRHAEIYKCFLERSMNPHLGIPESLDTHLTDEDLLEGLHSLKITASYPVLLSTFRADPKQFSDVLRALVSHALRYYTIGGLQSGRMGNTYAELAQEIFLRQRPAIQSVRERLNQAGNNISDEEFRTKFVAKNDWKATEAKWVLRTIEDHLRMESVAEANLTLEHVLPQGIFNGGDESGQQWDVDFTWSSKLHSEYVARLGNMTLLSGKKNSALGKMRFLEKIESDKGYKKSTELHISKSIANAKSWGPSEIDARSEYLARVALEIFQV